MRLDVVRSHSLGNGTRGRLQMAERDGQRISDVVWGRRLLEVEEQLDHLLHLVLLCTAVADDRALDRCGRVGHDRHAGFRGGEQRDAARLAELEREALDALSSLGLSVSSNGDTLSYRLRLLTG